MRVVKHQLREAKTLYDFTLLQQSDDDKNRVAFLSERDMSIIWTAVYFADKVQPRVFYDGQNDLYNVVSDEDFQIFKDYVNSLRVTLGEWPVSNLYLERIAIALESIDAKQQSVMSAQELLDYLEDTYGLTSFVYKAAGEVFGMLPDLSVQLPLTDIIKMAWDTLWRSEIRVMAATHTATTASITSAITAHLPVAVASALTDKLLGIADLILTLTGQLRNWMFGTFNILDGVVKPIWQWWFDIGGEPEPIPDGDEIQLRQAVALEAIAALTPTVNVDVTCSACGTSGGGGCSSCGVGAGPVVQPDPAPGQPDPGPPNPADPPSGYPIEGNPPYDEYKCKAINFLLDSYLSYVNNYTSLAGILSTYSALVLSLMGINLFFAPLSPFFTALLTAVSTGFLWSYLLTVLPGLTGLAALFTSYHENLTDSKDETVCLLYEAQDVSEARTILETWITDALPVGMPESWVSYHMDNLFPNNVLNILFEFYAGADSYEGVADCSACVCEPFVFTFDFDEEGWTVFQNNTADTYWAGGSLNADLVNDSPPPNLYCGWQFTFGVGERPIIAAGDSISVEYVSSVERPGGNVTLAYLEIYYGEASDATFASAIPSTTPQTITVPLGAFEGERINSIKIYEDTIQFAHTSTFDNVSVLSCSGETI